MLLDFGQNPYLILNVKTFIKLYYRGHKKVFIFWSLLWKMETEHPTSWGIIGFNTTTTARSMFSFPMLVEVDSWVNGSGQKFLARVQCTVHMTPLSFNVFKVNGILNPSKVSVGCFLLAMIALHATSICRGPCNESCWLFLKCAAEKAVLLSNLCLGKVALRRIEKGTMFDVCPDRTHCFDAPSRSRINHEKYTKPLCQQMLPYLYMYTIYIVYACLIYPISIQCIYLRRDLDVLKMCQV